MSGQTKTMDVLLALTEEEARNVHDALKVAIQLMGEVDVPPEAPLYGARPRLVTVAKRLDHERRHRGAVPNPNLPDARST